MIQPVTLSLFVEKRYLQQPAIYLFVELKARVAIIFYSLCILQVHIVALQGSWKSNDIGNFFLISEYTGFIKFSLGHRFNALKKDEVTKDRHEERHDHLPWLSLRFSNQNNNICSIMYHKLKVEYLLEFFVCLRDPIWFWLTLQLNCSILRFSFVEPVYKHINSLSETQCVYSGNKGPNCVQLFSA